MRAGEGKKEMDMDIRNERIQSSPEQFGHSGSTWGRFELYGRCNLSTQCEAGKIVVLAIDVLQSKRVASLSRTIVWNRYLYRMTFNGKIVAV